MTKSFKFETNQGVVLDIDVHIECRDRDGADFSYDIEWIGKPNTNFEVKFDTLSDSDKLRLNKDAEEIAADNACYAAQEYAEGAADAYHDRMKDE